MNYTNVFNKIKEASLFDLYRLNSAISMLLNDPDRLLLIKRQLKVNDQITYFDATQNKSIEATIIDIRRTTAVVCNCHNGKNYVIPFFMININSKDINIYQYQSCNQKHSVDKNQLKVGDIAGFVDSSNEEKYGRVIRLNQKTTTLLVNENSKWRVSYKFLFTTIDGNSSSYEHQRVIGNLKELN